MITIYNLLVSFAKVLAAMSPWLVVGFFAAGVIAVWIPRAWVNRVMGGSSGFSGILRAVLVGVPLPICSCGVLPIATGLRRNGAGKGATAAFLISTPQTGIDSILATYALMGPVFAIARHIAAALTGLVGGAVVSAVGGDDASPSAVDDAPPRLTRPRLNGRRLHPTGFSRNLFEGRVYRIVKTTNQPAK